jgi:hypothetical protein
MRVLSSNPNVMLIYHFDFFSYIMVYTSIYRVYLSIYQYKPISHDCIGISWYIPVCTKFVSVHTSMYLFCLATHWSLVDLTIQEYSVVHRGSSL